MNRFIWIALLLIFRLNSSFGQITLIPDSNFESYLVFWGCDTLPLNGSVPTAAIDTVTIVNVPSSFIGDLTGLQDFASLIYLDCSYNYNINSITLPPANSIEYLNVGYTGLDSLDITECPNLKELRCRNNSITFLDLSNSPQLTKIWCNNNNLNSLDVSNNDLVTYLNCSGNSIAALDVSGMSNLNELRFNGCELTTIDLSNNLNLSFLEADNNELTHIEMGEFYDLAQLGCTNNHLTSLDLSHQPYLSFFDCSNNNMNCLNLRGRYSDWLDEINTTGNPNLSCIEADDTVWAEANWTTIDSWTSFSNDCNNSCSTAGLYQYESDLYNFYPNPTNDFIYLSNHDQIIDIKILSLKGSIVEIFSSPPSSLNLDALDSGIYIIVINTEKETVRQRLIKN